MIYITVRQSPKTRQITLEDILRGEVPLPNPASREPMTATLTYKTEAPSEALVRLYDIPSIIKSLTDFNRANAQLFEAERSSLYHTYYIPKHSGGLRRIDEPNPALMAALRDLKSIFETRCRALYHTSAFAYVKGRSTLDSIKKHQQNQSRWFLKTDFSNFFGSTTFEFTVRMFSMIFPFSEVMKDKLGAQQLQKALSLCFLNEGLPQGTPISPTITNLMMIPIDHALVNGLRANKFVYTRYADDILVSHRFAFDHRKTVEYIDGVLASFNAPFRIKPQKTRYGSSAGSNWNLGVMLNSDNDITIGYKRKRELKAMLHNFVTDCQTNVVWDIHDVQVMSGLISYYKMVEPQYIKEFIPWFNRKHGVNVMLMIKRMLKGEKPLRKEEVLR